MRASAVSGQSHCHYGLDPKQQSSRRKGGDRHSAMFMLVAAAAAVSLAGVGVARAQTEIVGWNTTGVDVTSAVNSVNATTVDPGLGGVSAPVTLSYGSGFGEDYNVPGYYTNGFIVYSAPNSNSLATAQSHNQYFQFTLTPNAGEAMNIDSIIIPNWMTQNPVFTMYVTTSLNNYATSLGSTTFGGSLESSGSINLGSALQGLTSPLTIQLDVSGNWGYNLAGFGGPGTSGDSLEVMGSVAAPVTPVTWTGLNGSGGNGTWNAVLTNSWKPTAGGAATAFGNNDPVTFDDTGVNTNITVDAGGVNPGAITFINNTVPYTFSGGSIGGSTATTLTISGTGAVTLNNSNTFAGGTTVNSGTLTAGNDNALGTGTLVVNGGTVKFTSAAPSISSLSGTGGSVILSNTSLTLGSDNSSSTYAGTIAQALSTSGGINKAGTGTFKLSASNTYTGGTNVNAGTLLAVNTAGSATGSGSVSVASGATLGGSGFIGNSSAGTVVTIQSGGILAPHVTANGYSTLTINGTLDLNSGSILDFNLGSSATDEVIASSVSFGGSSETLNVSFPGGVAPGLYPILQASSFSGQGSPVFTVSGPSSANYSILAPGDPGNTFANAYVLDAAQLEVTWTNAAGTGNWNTTDSNWNGSGGQTYVDGDQVAFDNSSFSGTPGTQAVTVTGTVNPGSVVFNNSIGYDYVIAPSYNFGNVIAGSGSVTLNGSGTVTFGGPAYEGNSYTGGTFLNAGVLNINDDNKLGAAPSTNSVNLTFNGGTLQAAGDITDLSGLRTFLLNSKGGTIDTNGNLFAINGNLITGPGALTVIGGGDLKFYSGYYNNPQGNLDQNTYSGGTIVNGTIVEIGDNGAGSVVSPTTGQQISSVFGTGPITFMNGATLTMDNWQDLDFVNAFTFNGVFNYIFNWTAGDSGHGLVLGTQDTNSNVLATPNVTTIAKGGATFNFALALNVNNNTTSARMLINQQVVGGSLTVNTQIDSTHGTGFLQLANSSNTFDGLTLNSGLIIASGGIGSAGSGPITVNGGGIIFSNTAPAAVYALLQSGYNNGNWNGSTGINSTAAATDPTHLHALGMYQPPAGTNISLEGQGVNSAAVAVKYTYYGDANLDGQVDASDYSLIDNGYLSQSGPTPLSGWQNGDFNYDGVINGSDYTLIDNAFNMQGAQIDGQIAATAVETDEIAGAGSAGGVSVPEPASLGFIAIGAATVLSRRKTLRRH